MDHDVYQKMGELLDTRGIGFPLTKSGVEFKILKILFTEEEAAMYLKLSLQPETLPALAKRIGKNPEELKVVLDRMYANGTIVKAIQENMVLYAALPFAIGMLEANARRVAQDAEFANLVTQYFDEGLGMAASKPPLAMRPVPIDTSIEPFMSVAPHESLKEIVKANRLIAVTDCLCRTRKRHSAKHCDKPTEVCIQFGLHAHMGIQTGMSRQITQEEALSILAKAEEIGLVPMPSNHINPVILCNCCGDCCGVLHYVALNPKPAEIVLSNYYAVLDSDLCVGCETCLDRCQVNAITMNSAKLAEISLDRCIGCGLCVSTCEPVAISLKVKPEAERQIPPTADVH